MPRARCPACGVTVEFRGMMSGCPNCGGLVRVPIGAVVDDSGPAEAVIVPETTEAWASAAEVRRERDAVKRVILVAVGIVLGTGVFIALLFMALRGPAKSVVEKDETPVRKTRVVAQLPPTSAPAPVNPSLFAALTSDATTQESEHNRIAKPQAAESMVTTAPASSPATQRETASVVEDGRAKLKPVVRTHAIEFSDADVERSIKRGVQWMISQFPGKRLKGADGYEQDTFVGVNALCVYSLLVAGEQVQDHRLDINGEFVKGLIARMKEMPMDGNKATYSRAMRIMALAVHDRPEDRAALEADARWLMKASIEGAYSYSMPAAGAKRATSSWDNSNSQYGALGVWAAAMVGMDIPQSYWAEVEAHWADCQAFSGGWAYGRGGQATLPMTAAGVNMLYVAADQLGIDRVQRKSRTGMAETLERGLEWLDEGKHAIELGGHRGYTLYSLERVGLASGLKFFGDYDWYRTLAQQTVTEQTKEGSWSGGDPVPAEVAFSLLFLARGRVPICMSKLRFDGNWNNRPRDLQHLGGYVSKQLERPVNWEVADLDRDWKDWTDSPVLMISSDKAPTLGDKDIANLRAYAEAGGVIFTHAENGSAAFNTFAQDLAKTLFPHYGLKELAEDHPIYSVVVNLKPRPKLLGVSNGSRLLMVHSPGDITAKWARKITPTARGAADVGFNIFIYSAGKREFRNRMDTSVIPEPTEAPVATVKIARVKYEGNWDSEPGAWRREARVIERDSAIKVEVAENDAYRIAQDQPVMAHLRCDAGMSLTDGECQNLKEYVVKGGVLIIEHADEKVLSRIVNVEQLMAMDEKNPILAGEGIAMDKVGKAQLNDFAKQSGSRAGAVIRIGEMGKGHVIVSDLDLAEAMLDRRTWGVAGYQPAWGQGFVKNVFLWAIRVNPVAEKN